MIKRTVMLLGGILFLCCGVTSAMATAVVQNSVKISTLQELQNISCMSNTTYVLQNDIDAQGATITPRCQGGSQAYFKGVLDGDGHTINNLKIDCSAVSGGDGCGLFSQIEWGSARVRDITFKNVSISAPPSSADTPVGIVAGYLSFGSRLQNVVVTDSIVDVPNSNNVGGLIGEINAFGGQAIAASSIKNSSIIGRRAVGGLAGSCMVTSANAFASADHDIVQDTRVQGISQVGGLVGVANHFNVLQVAYIIDNDYAMHYPAIQGKDIVGGLIGAGSTDAPNSIAESFVSCSDLNQICIANTGPATGTITGGLMGSAKGATIFESYSHAGLFGVGFVGGIIGAYVAPTGHSANNVPCMKNVYAADTFINTGAAHVGGLIAVSSVPSYVTNSFWDYRLAHVFETSGGGAPATTAAMQTSTLYTESGWSTNMWAFPTNSYPTLKWYQPAH